MNVLVAVVLHCDLPHGMSLEC